MSIRVLITAVGFACALTLACGGQPANEYHSAIGYSCSRCYAGRGASFRAIANASERHVG